jgi:hypothetical protein
MDVSLIYTEEGACVHLYGHLLDDQLVDLDDLLDDHGPLHLPRGTDQAALLAPNPSPSSLPFDHSSFWLAAAAKFWGLFAHLAEHLLNDDLRRPIDLDLRRPIV